MQQEQFDPFAVAQQFAALRASLVGGGPASFQMPSPHPVMQAAGTNPAVQQFMDMRQQHDTAGDGYDQWVDTIARIKRLTPQERAALHSLGMGESGGRNIPQGIHDINTDKGTPAFGPWQVIKPTFDRYKEPGYDDWHDPIANGLASVNYQRARYGGVNRSKPGY